MRLFTPIQDRFQLTGPASSHVIDAIVATAGEPLSIDELINATLRECEKIPDSCRIYRHQIQELHSRLALGRLHLAVVGEFNRGKSTFINGLIGERLLPTSVLPITTVPTRIIYGPEITCTIRFLNKPEIIIRSSHEKISAALLQYVAEEYNPKNRYSVESVEVTVPSPLLENGTMLIDTPGFGSTYLHNTKTALDALTDCDAALFLLSADPPMTQTEVEFLKQVIRHVPQLFFILNKIDLLTSQQLKRVDNFIKKVLETSLSQTEKPHLFHICARYAERAQQQSLNDPNWSSSGMEAIKKDIVDFMAREKYFTLSQALNDKLREAVNSIIYVMQQEKNDFDAPVIQLNKERDSLLRENETLRKGVEKEYSLVTAEKKALINFLGDQFSAGKPKLIKQIRDAMAILLDASSCSSDSLKSVTIALNNIVPEALEAFKVRLLAQLNRPLKKALFMHSKEFSRYAASVIDCIAGAGSLPESKLQETFDTLEISTEDLPPVTQSFTPLTITLQWNDWPFGRQKKLQRLHERYDHKLEELLRSHFFAFSKQVRSRIDSIFLKIDELLRAEYKQLFTQLEQVMLRKETAISKNVAQNNRATTRLTAAIESFQSILTHLH